MIFLVLLVLFRLSGLVISRVLSGQRFSSIRIRASFAGGERGEVGRFICSSLVSLPDDDFMLILSGKAGLISPTICAGRGGEVSVVGQGTRCAMFGRVRLSSSACSNRCAFVEGYGMGSGGANRRILFTTIPGERAGVLTCSSSTRGTSGAMAFKGFEVFYFIRSRGDPCASLLTSSRGVRLRGAGEGNVRFVNLGRIVGAGPGSGGWCGVWGGYATSCNYAIFILCIVLSRYGVMQVYAV